jgi:hypothetical protein
MMFLSVVFGTLLSLGGQAPEPITIGICEASEPAAVERIAVRAWPGPGAREGRLAMWKAFLRLALSERSESKGRRICFASSGGPETGDMRTLMETAGVITRNQALFAPLILRAEPAAVTPKGPVTVRILESAEAIVIVGLNDSADTHRVKIAFPPDVPEAIWQEMEAGHSVNFVMEKTGPTYTRTFAPQDVLVLAIRKRLR